MLLSSFLFVVLQALYVEKTIQCFLLRVSGLSIFLVAGIVVVYLALSISAILVHATYIIFYAKAKDRKVKYAQNWKNPKILR